MVLAVVLVMEIAATIIMIVGAYMLFTSDDGTMALYGLVLSALTLLALLFGQRIAKDYVGAMTLVVYYIPTILGIYLLTK